MIRHLAALAALVVMCGLAISCGSSTTPEIQQRAHVVLVSFAWAAPSRQTYGHPSVAGVVRNDGHATAKNTKVYCRVLGEGLVVVETDEAIVGTVAHGQTVPFTVIFYGRTDWYGCYPTQWTDITIHWND